MQSAEWGVLNAECGGAVGRGVGTWGGGNVGTAASGAADGLVAAGRQAYAVGVSTNSAGEVTFVGGSVGGGTIPVVSGQHGARVEPAGHG